jgi:hypothetical protein
MSRGEQLSCFISGRICRVEHNVFAVKGRWLLQHYMERGYDATNSLLLDQAQLADVQSSNCQPLSAFHKLRWRACISLQ